MLPIDSNPPKAVIGVLTPHTGGFYYGSVVNAILATVRHHDAVAVAFETSRLRVLKDHEVLGSATVDGWIAVNEFSDPALLRELRARNVPIVHLHSKPDVPHGSVVLPDNEGGARSVTEHLFAHGHRKIAFAGNLDHVDVAERYLGYRSAFAGASIVAPEELVYDTPHHKEDDGREVGLRLLELLRAAKEAGGDPPVTALVAATDRLALGALAVLTDAGVRVPEDFAIVGFDDAEAAQFAEPPLTTVKQSFAEAARCAVVELLSAIEEQRQPNSEIRVPAQPVVRRSCGCKLSHSMRPVSRPPRDRIHALTLELLALAGRNDFRRVTSLDWPEAERIARLVDEGARGADITELVRGALWRGYLTHKRDAESVVRAMELLESTFHEWTRDPDTRTRGGGILRELRVALMHQWQRAQRVKVAHYESVTEAAYRLAGELSRPELDDPAWDLRWIRWSGAYQASCALWDEYAGPRRAVAMSPSRRSSRPPRKSLGLRITGDYEAGQAAVLKHPSAPISPANFPPQALLSAAYERGAILTVASIPRGREEEYGLLAVVAPLAFEHLEYVGTPSDWAVQLGAALDRVEAERELRARAELDAVTGLPNRSTLLLYLDRLRRDPAELSFALLLIDLDDFKKINDSLGHEAGDQLLVQIANRLVEEFPDAGDQSRAQAVISRVGGDEFVVVLSGVDGEAEAVAAIERIQERLRQPYTLLGRTVFVSASFGVNFGRGQVASAQELLRDADTAMYKAKTRGLARHEIFHRGMHAQALEKLHLDAQLRLAIERSELELWYQPIVDLRTGQDAGAEALIRWRHPDQGLLLPGRFLPIAGDVGLSIPISEWVIRRACAEAVRFREQSGLGLYVNVNVPPDHIRHGGFVEFVEQALSESGLEADALGIEIVESTILDEPAKCTLALARLCKMGVRIAIDDFGTGYSNLSYLRDFPVKTLKIDREFVKNVPGNSRDNGIARAIIAMGQALGLSVVAEGIETLEQVQFLKQTGCDLAQGFLISVPLEPACYLERLHQARSAMPPTSVRRTDRTSDWPDVGVS